MVNLYITRHGETVWNREMRLQGWQNSPLTEKGIMQGKTLNGAVKKYGIEKIYSSPSERAALTAMYANGDLDLPIIYLEELKEMNMGDWEGRTLEEIRMLEPENFENYWYNPFEFRKNSGEDFEEMLARSKKALDIIIRESQGQNVLVVTHGVTLKALMSWFAKGGFQEYWVTPVVTQTSISHVQIDEDDKGEILMYGDVSHHIEG